MGRNLSQIPETPANSSQAGERVDASTPTLDLQQRAQLGHLVNVRPWTGTQAKGFLAPGELRRAGVMTHTRARTMTIHEKSQPGHAQGFPVG